MKNISIKNHKGKNATAQVHKINMKIPIKRFKIIYFQSNLKCETFFEKYHHKINNNIWLASVTYAAPIKLYFGIKIIFQIILNRVIKIFIFNKIDSFFDAIKI